MGCDGKDNLSNVGYGIIGGAVVFLVYDVIHNLLENGGLTKDITYRLDAFVPAIFAGLLFIKTIPKINQIKIEHILIIAVVICVITILVVNFFISNIWNPITIKPEWSTYTGTGILAVSGTVYSVLPNEKVLIQVFYPNGKLYNSTKVFPINNTTDYVYNFNIKPLDYYKTKIFTINVTYGGITKSARLNIEQ